MPKPGTTKGRSLSISSLEDKIVEQAVKRVLEPIYESMFEASSYGYRPRSSPHKCLDVLGRTIQQKSVNYIVESDVRSFFDKVNHKWMVKFLRHRIGDERIIRLMLYLGWLIEANPHMCDCFVHLSQPLPDRPDLLLYRLLDGLTEAIDTCFWLHKDLLRKGLT